MSFNLQIHTGNAAFDPDPGRELARILRTVAERLENGDHGFRTIRDENGNAVGHYTSEDE